jgi:hypothetical protein
MWWIGGASGLAIIAGGFTRWWTMDRAEPAAPTVVAEAPPAEVTDVPIAPPVVLPPVSEMDPFLRAMLGALSARPELANWLATNGLIQQMAVVIDRVSRGGTPAAGLKVIAPSSEFRVDRRGRARQIDPASYERYDGLAEAIAGVDPAAAATAYRTIRPRLNEAYRNLGRTDAEIDVAVQQALEVMIATPIPEGPVRLVEGKGATWAFADPALERLDPAQKQLLRMGPENAARIIDTLRQVQRQLQQ